MNKFFNKFSRIIFGLLILFGFSRAIVQFLPGDPLDTLMEETGTALPSETLRHDLGMDRPLWQSLPRDVLLRFKGDWGNSTLTQLPVGPTLAERTITSLTYGLASATLAFVCSLAIALAAGHRGNFADRLAEGLGIALPALPLPWLGPILLWIFSVRLNWFELKGGWVLPLLAIVPGIVGFWARLMKDRVQSRLNHPSCLAARGRGLSEVRVRLKYALLPESRAIFGILATQIGHLLAGQFVAEVLFQIPGLGSLLVQAVLTRDFVTLEAAFFVVAAFSWICTQLGNTRAPA